MIDETTKKQLLLLATALNFANELDQKMSAIMALLSFFGQDNKGDKTILETISTMTQAPSARPPDVASAMISYMVPPNQWHNWETREYFDRKLVKALQSATLQQDTSLANVVTKQMMNSIKLAQRQEVFREANENVLEAAQTMSEYSRKGLVIWRSRSQADDLCQQYNRKVMTVKEFQSIYPIHHNCMCTSELIPESMSDEWIERHRFNDTRPKSERIPNTPKRMREKGDKEQYERYNRVIGKNMPTFDKFKELKYNSGEDFEKLNLLYNDEKLKNAIRSGKYKLTINGQQNKHILGHHDYKDGRSYLLPDIDPQELVNKYAGTGEIIRDRHLKWSKRFEEITISKFVGFNIPSGAGQLQATRTFRIAYGANGTHIFPVEDKEIKK